MREWTKQSPEDRGEVASTGRCQVCGAEGRTISIPWAPEPNQLCPRCAIEYGETLGSGEEEP